VASSFSAFSCSLASCSFLLAPFFLPLRQIACGYQMASWCPSAFCTRRSHIPLSLCLSQRLLRILPERRACRRFFFPVAGCHLPCSSAPLGRRAPVASRDGDDPLNFLRMKCDPRSHMRLPAVEVSARGQSSLLRIAQSRPAGKTSCCCEGRELFGFEPRLPFHGTVELSLDPFLHVSD